MGRPKKGVLSTFSTIVKDRILALRQGHSEWGAITIWVELLKDKNLKSLKIPKPSSIALYLNDAGLCKKYEKHVDMPQSKLHPPSAPHDIWQIDGQGAVEVEGLGKVNLINTKDVFSKTYCGSLPAYSRGHAGSPSANEYQYALRLAFCEFGLPEKIQTDHAAVFYENKGKSPFPTRFHLWLKALGVDMIYSRKYRPTDQGVVERSHQTLSKQILVGSCFESMTQLHQYCDERRKSLNEEIPCSTTNGLPPLKAFPKAIRTAKQYRPEIEEKLISLKRVYQFLEKGKWYRKANKNKTLHLGGQWYYLKQVQLSSMVTIMFDATEQLLIFQDVNEHLIDIQPIKGITHEYLMGPSFFEASIPHFQLQLPFTWEDNLLSMTLLDNT